jgi:thiamine pyrophosphate-dependent acetolactate synthase large subunit-like protein
MSGARALVESLKREGVKVLFGFPGGFNMPIYDALYDERSDRNGIRHVLVRHEQSAVHMADGYARTSGKAGVCLATSGPGATNLITGLATAFHDSSPVIAITGQVPTSVVGTDAFQEADIIGMTTSVTKYGFQPLSVKEIPPSIRAAFQLATSPPTQPVIIDVPRNVQQDEDDLDLSTGPGPSEIRLTSKLQGKRNGTQLVNAMSDGNESYPAPVRALEVLAPLLPANVIVTADVQLAYDSKEDLNQAGHRTLISSSHFSTSGFGFPAALGAKVARPEAHVIAIEDRMGFLMTENSLATSFEERIPITVVVLNDSHGHSNGRWTSTMNRLNSIPDLVKLAESYGVQGIRVKTLSELENAVRGTIQSTITTVIDVSMNL